jgi:hypothetical protein
MSAIMTLRVHGDPQELEKRAAANPDAIRAISDRAREHGLIAHRFYGSEDGQNYIGSGARGWPARAGPPPSVDLRPPA